ncbi:hypothetical protein GXM_06642 [Nostoc sphaeroides CCNUC1]|uniref:Uncharacterized protein n=1 Tax=Nostoc sphaeroides CCNUC1 TaxID=2653204 RepID=A0A5P8W8V2_9NOSO|nr:hypothetical protein GXM_06642 [Nostoc sphaeroides CCNUC1]
MDYRVAGNFQNPCDECVAKTPILAAKVALFAFSTFFTSY